MAQEIEKKSKDKKETKEAVAKMFEPGSWAAQVGLVTGYHFGFNTCWHHLPASYIATSWLLPLTSVSFILYQATAGQ